VRDAPTKSLSRSKRRQTCWQSSSSACKSLLW
jgi:hypothetical protein